MLPNTGPAEYNDDDFMAILGGVRALRGVSERSLIKESWESWGAPSLCRS